MEADKQEKRLEHIASHLDGGFDVPGCLAHIENGTGSPPNCVRHLVSHALASAISAWFRVGDLQAFKQWTYVAGKLQIMATEWDPPTFFSIGRAWDFFGLVLSDAPDCVELCGRYEKLLDKDEVEKHKRAPFFVNQFLLALRGDWPRLRERCEKVLADPPSALKKFNADEEFYLALANTDIKGMRRALEYLVSPKGLRARNNGESGYTEDLISTPACMYAKLAWRHGYRIEIDTPYIPREWLPVVPLANYDEPYPFMRRFGANGILQ